MLSTFSKLSSPFGLKEKQIVSQFQTTLDSPLSGVVPYEVREAGGFSSWLSSKPSDLLFRGSLSATGRFFLQNGRSVAMGIKIQKFPNIIKNQDVYQIIP